MHNETAEMEKKRWRTVYKFEGGKVSTVPIPGNTAPAVFEPAAEIMSDTKRTVYQFEPVEAREVWLTCSDDFNLNEFEVLNEKGENVALFSKGAGVTVSASSYTYWLPAYTHAALWQMQYDLGIKWLRLSYYHTPFTWHGVERQKGVYTVDPYLDQLVTQARDCGIEVCLTLGPGGHQFYKEGQETVEGFSNYVKFMVNHFKGRIKYYEILNEFYNQDSYRDSIDGKVLPKQGPVDEMADAYVTISLPAAKEIRRIDPQAKIIMCGPCPLVADFILACLKKGMKDYVDVLSWHPYSFTGDTDDDYPPEFLDKPRHIWAPEEMTRYSEAIEYLREEAAKLGFEGELQANESGAYAIHRDRTSQLIAAKYLARSIILHTSLKVPMFWNETTSLLRPSWQPFWGNSEPELKPAYSYYVMRTLCTVLDCAEPSDLNLNVQSDSDKAFEVYSFNLPADKKLAAVWIPEKSRKKRLDDYEGSIAELKVKTKEPKQVYGIDILNGRSQKLKFSYIQGDLTISDLVVKDYPLLIILEY
jgi:hypothetical protein